MKKALVEKELLRRRVMRSIAESRGSELYRISTPFGEVLMTEEEVRSSIRKAINEALN